MEWEFETLEAGSRYTHVLYASEDSRPVHFFIDGHELGTELFLTESTGGYYEHNLQWSSLPAVSLEAGKHVLRMTWNGYSPHIKGFFISGDTSAPQKENDPFYQAALAAKMEANKKSFDQNKTVLETLDCPEEVRHDFLTRLEEIPLDDSEYVTKRTDWEMSLSREILLENNVRQILFVKRKTNQGTHYYTDFIDGMVHFGTELNLLDVATGAVKSLVPELAGGVIHRCALSFDGTKVVFDYKVKIGEGFRIWEVGIDGKNLRQITFPPADEENRKNLYHHPGNEMYYHHTDDMHPCYLPDGGIVFVSTRCERSILCDGNDLFTTSVLYRVNADGTQLEQLSQGALSEAAPSITSDGRVLYTRWEYVDNGSVTNKGLWLCPSGRDGFGRPLWPQHCVAACPFCRAGNTRGSWSVCLCGNTAHALGCG